MNTPAESASPIITPTEPDGLGQEPDVDVPAVVPTATEAQRQAPVPDEDSGDWDQNNCDPAMDGTYHFPDGTVGTLPGCIANYGVVEGNPSYPFCGGQICIGDDGNPVLTVKQSNTGETIYCDASWCYRADGTEISMAEMPNPDGRPNHANSHEEACEWGYLPAEDC
ncbi:hypothetical protein [Hoyosella subflava]|uniref:hypothetical protein n=1 Tax=Hoyosella subflava TaxID=639313 RepID=UPI0013051C33|nr:hypothetical protein [Hoyosella subflava]